jgi:hypothetical protein
MQAARALLSAGFVFGYLIYKYNQRVVDRRSQCDDIVARGTAGRSKKFSRRCLREMSWYRVVFQRDGRDDRVLYWNGSLEETRSLAERIAVECEADAFQIFDFTEAEVGSEEPPFQDQGSDC